MDRLTFQQRFRRAARAAREFAAELIEEPLPERLLFRLRLNASYDGNASGDVRLYPGERSPQAELDQAEVVDALYRDGRVPQWVDVQVVAETDDACVLSVTACGRFSADDATLYYTWTDVAPFGVKGPFLPYPYEPGQRFSLYHAATCRTEAQLARIERNAQKVRFLTLQGSVFDDHALSRIGALPQLAVCELVDVPITGAGLAALARWPSLRHLRMQVTSSTLTFRHLPAAPVLECVSLDGNLSTLDAIDRCAVAELRIANRSAPRADARVPSARLRKLTLDLPVVPDWVDRLPALRELGLHVRDANDEAIASALQRIAPDELETLSMRGTPLTRAIFSSLQRFRALNYVDLVDSRVTVDELETFAASRPGLRHHPRRVHSG